MKQNKHLNELLRQTGLPGTIRDAVYIAVPISSGARLWALAREHNVVDVSKVRRRFVTDYESKVLRPNLVDAERTAIQAGRLFPAKWIVNPAKVDVQGWSQAQYRRAWKMFISRFVGAIVAPSTWSYSQGCVDEVLHASRTGIPVFDISGNRLSMNHIQEELERARGEARRKGLHVPFLGKIPKFQPRSDAPANGRKQLVSV